jgi:hypothetical protein
LRLLLLALDLLGLGTHARELFVQPRIGLGFDARHFGFEGKRGSLFGLLTGLDLGAFAKQLDFPLRVFVGAPRFGGFFAQTFELREQSGFGFGTHARDFAFERASRFLVGFTPRFLIARRVLLLAARAFGFFTQTRDLGIEARLGFGTDALHFFPELAGRGFLSHHARFLRGEFAKRFRFQLRLRLSKTRFTGFFAESIELAAQTCLRLFADA